MEKEKTIKIHEFDPVIYPFRLWVMSNPTKDFFIASTYDMRILLDERRYNVGNYFKTREAAEKVAEQIREIFRKSKAE